jgi:hypothetical protein
MATPFKITSQAYLWVPGDWPDGQFNIVVISAHGAVLNNSPRFTPPKGSVFKFYSLPRIVLTPTGTR